MNQIAHNTTRPLAETVGYALSLLMVTAGVAVALKGPQVPIPMHFDISGTPDRFGSRYELAMVAGGMGLLAAFVTYMKGHQARMATDPARIRGLRQSQWVTPLICFAVAVVILWTTLGKATGMAVPDVRLLASGLLSFALVVTGAFLGRVGPNPLYGIRTPWAYRSRLAWDKANRLAGRLLFATGLGGMVATAIAPQPHVSVALIVLTISFCAAAAFESWRVWKRDPEALPF